MLREQISKYDKTNFIRREEVLDFTGLTNAVSLILANWSLSTLGQGLMSVATPRVVQNYKDSKQVFLLLFILMLVFVVGRSRIEESM